MRVLIYAVVLLATMTAHGSNCTQSIIEIADQLQAGRSGMVAACEVRQILAAEERHVELTGGNCEEGTGAKLIAATNQIMKGAYETNVLQSRITISNLGTGQPADTYKVTGVLDVNGDCKVTSVKLAPISEGAPTTSQPYPYKQHPSQQN